MTSNVRRDKGTRRHDLAALLAGILQPGADNAAANALPLQGGRHAVCVKMITSPSRR